MMPVALPSPDYIPGLEETQTPPAPHDDDEHELMFIQPHDLDFMPEPIYPEYIPLEDEHILLAEEQPLPPIVSSTAESPGYVAESDPEEDSKEYEEDETEDEAEVERLLAMPTSSPSPLTSLSPPSTGERLARCTAPAALPSPPLPPSLYPPPVNRRDDIPESEQPPRKRLCLSTLGSRYEVGESSTKGRGVDYGFADTVETEIRHRGIGEVGYGIRDTWIDPTEAVPEMAPTTLEGVDTRVTELAKLHEHDTQDLYALLEDVQDGRTHISQWVAMDSQRVDLLMGDRMTLQETIWIVVRNKKITTCKLLDKVERFMNYLEEQTDREAMINSIKNGDQPLPRVTQVSISGTSSSEQPPLKDKSMWSDQEKRIQKIDRLARSLLIQELSNDIYSLNDSNKTAKDLWDALARHMLGSEYGEQDRKAAVLYEYETFKATEGELLLDTYIRYLLVINDLNNKNLIDINIDTLYNILKQNQRDVNDAMGSKKKTVVVTSDPLALIAEKINVSRSKEKVVVSSDSEGSEANDFSELKKITSLLAKAFNRRKFYSKTTNNNLRTSSTSQSANKKQEFVK
nr:hypothetical protein [Tanacetum cinerariifolium]